MPSTVRTRRSKGSKVSHLGAVKPHQGMYTATTHVAVRTLEQTLQNGQDEGGRFIPLRQAHHIPALEEWHA